MELKIIDNFLTKKYHKEILELLTSGDGTFPWYYQSNITARELNPEKNRQFNNYGFSHGFEDISTPDGQNLSIYAAFMKPMLYQIMDIVNCNLVLRARAVMNTWTGKEKFLPQPHTDFPYPNIASIFYVNESNGDTILYNEREGVVTKDFTEYDRVSPKPNRLILFDGDA